MSVHTDHCTEFARILQVEKQYQTNKAGSMLIVIIMMRREDVIPWQFSDSCFLDYSNMTTKNFSWTLHLTQHRLSPCGYECLIWVLVAETVTLGLSDEMILCYDGQKITTNSSAKIYVVWRKKTDRHVDYLKLNLQVSQTLGTFRAHLPLDARVR